MTISMKQDDVLFEILDLYEAGKSKSEVTEALVLKGMSKDVADSMAEAGIKMFTARLSYVDRKKAETSVDMLKWVKEIVFKIDKGQSKESILSWLMQEDMPLGLANGLLEEGAAVFVQVVAERRQSLMKRGIGLALTGTVIGFWSYVQESDSKLPYILTTILVIAGIAVYLDAKETTANRLPYWPNLE